MPLVDEELLEVDSREYLYHLDGHRYTGRAHRVSGHHHSYQIYQGMPHGLEIEVLATGHAVRHCRHGVVHGLTQEFDAQGRLVVEEHYRHAIRSARIEYDKVGREQVVSCLNAPTDYGWNRAFAREALYATGRFATVQGRTELLVEGAAIPSQQVHVRLMHAGKPWKTLGVRSANFSAELPREVFDEYWRVLWPTWFGDCQRYPDPECRLESTVLTAMPSSLEQALQTPSLAKALYEHVCWDEVLNWFGDAPHDETRFVINGVRVTTAGSTIVIEGDGRFHDTSMTYRLQDI